MKSNLFGKSHDFSASAITNLQFSGTLQYGQSLAIAMEGLIYASRLGGARSVPMTSMFGCSAANSCQPRTRTRNVELGVIHQNPLPICHAQFQRYKYQKVSTFDVDS